MPDLLLVNGTVITMDPARPRASAVAVSGDRIAGVFDARPGAPGPSARVIDLKGATLLPGFHDAHNHMIGFGLGLAEADLRVGSLAELYERVAGHAAGAPDGDWVIGSGYDQNKTGGHPHRDALDRAAPGRRVWLKHTSGHMCVVSSPVLADLGITDGHVPRIDGGRVATDEAGRPTGLLEERAQELVGRLTRPYPLAILADAVARAARVYASEGLTSVTEAGIGGGWIGHSPAELAAYQAARDAGALLVRAELMVASDVLHPVGAHPDDGLDLGLDLGIRTGFGDDWLRVGAMKIFTDGSLIARTAAMTSDYEADAGNRGYLQEDAAEITARIVAAHRAGWQVAAHAIGDHAIDTALSAFGTALERYPRADARHRVEHFAAARPDQVALTARHGIVPVPQGRFASELGDGMLAAVGRHRHAWLYRQRSLLDAGLVLPGSSDRPVVRGTPLLGIHDMVNRRTSSGAPFNDGEAVTAFEALRAYTWGSAFASRAESVKGSVEAGKLADFTVLSEDPTAVDPSRIAGLEVLATITGGEIRYGAG
ncbi:MAG: amidohydrolase, partial [Streptosporangiales bacterium]|nr:amidohydrolase [Streptosporangiales bacterium]